MRGSTPVPEKTGSIGKSLNQIETSHHITNNLPTGLCRLHEANINASDIGIWDGKICEQMVTTFKLQKFLLPLTTSCYPRLRLVFVGGGQNIAPQFLERSVDFSCRKSQRRKA